MKKRMILLLCAVGMIFTLTACQKEDGTQESAKDAVSEINEDEYELYGADGFFDREYKELWFGYSIKTPSGYNQGNAGWAMKSIRRIFVSI